MEKISLRTVKGIRAFRPERVPNPNFRSIGTPDVFDSLESIDVEIGAGTGAFAVSYALAHCERHLVSIERTTNKFRAFSQRLNESSPPNLLACHTDAISWVTHHLGTRKIERCFILYPNPEAKSPNKRWIRSPFFGFLLSAMDSKSEIVIASNLKPYINEVEEWAVGVWGLEVVSKHKVTGPGRTNFEKKYLERGEDCWEILLKVPETFSSP